MSILIHMDIASKPTRLYIPIFHNKYWCIPSVSVHIFLSDKKEACCKKQT